MEIWGGLECTINRVGADYFDQLDYSGHYQRQEDLGKIASLGIKKLRYPILWEKHQKYPMEVINWDSTAARLDQLRSSEIDIIAGLVHHGSGPVFAGISTPAFIDGLGDYALQVATRFPWICYYTPVNEPLTTARFCGLYGLWHPHQKSDASFLRILVNECQATVKAMQNIRTVNPHAKLVQTEDLGMVHSTSALAYQADFENLRRWLSYDLLCGNVTSDHPLWAYLIDNGITVSELNALIDAPCPPSILGLNYYVTSERFLDEQTNNYPVVNHGGNAKVAYADVEAVRCADVELSGPKMIFNDAWNRYQIPIAVTEVHLHCGREDQLRWINYIHRALLELEQQGIAVVGITIWSLLGSYGWSGLLTGEFGNYEAGAFDVRSGSARETAVAKMIRSLATKTLPPHPLLACKGWWLRPDRVIYGQANKIEPQLTDPGQPCRPVIILGATGTLGQAFARICEDRNIPYKLLSRDELNLTRVAEIDSAIWNYQPWAIINTAGFVRVDDAESDAINCFLSNSVGPENLAIAAREHEVQLLTFSSDLVFDGKKGAAYTEQDKVNPLNLYGKSKAQAEALVLHANPEALIVRTSAFFSPWDKHNFVAQVLSVLQNNQQMPAAADVFISPTYVPDLVNACLDLLIDKEAGIWHLSNISALSWFDFAKIVAAHRNLQSSLIIPMKIENMGLIAKRPVFSVLGTNRGLLLPNIHHALDRFFIRDTG